MVVVGASGDVGRATVLECIARSWAVTAIARNSIGLDELTSAADSPLLATVTGDMSDEVDADAVARHPAVVDSDAVVVAVNTWAEPRSATAWTVDELLGYLRSNLVPALVVSRTVLPRMRQDGIAVFIGGGTADVLLRDSAHLSMAQAALRMFVRALAKETIPTGPSVHEAVIRAMVSGHRIQHPDGPGVVDAAAVATSIADLVEHGAGETVIAVPF